MKKSGIMISGLVALILIVMEGVAIIAGGYRTFSGIAKDREEAVDAEEQRYTDTYADPYTEPVTEPYTEPYVRESEPEIEAKTNMVEVPDLLGRDTELSKIITEGLGLYYYDTWYYNDFYDFQINSNSYYDSHIKFFDYKNRVNVNILKEKPWTNLS